MIFLTGDLMACGASTPLMLLYVVSRLRMVPGGPFMMDFLMIMSGPGLWKTSIVLILPMRVIFMPRRMLLWGTVVLLGLLVVLRDIVNRVVRQ